MGERQRVRRGSSGHQERRDLALEELAEPPLDALRNRIIAIGEREAVVGGGDRLENGRRDPGRVVACKVHGPVSCRVSLTVSFAANLGAKCAKVKRLDNGNSSSRGDGAQKFVLRSDFVVAPP
jgi:hypothetical protein